MFVAREVSEGMSPGDAHRLLADRGSSGAEESGRCGERRLDSARRARPVRGELSGLLSAHGGLSGRACPDAEEAERRFASLSPQLVIVELLLSGGVGGALIEQLKPSGALVIAISPLAAGDVCGGAGRRCVPAEADRSGGVAFDGARPAGNQRADGSAECTPHRDRAAVQRDRSARRDPLGRVGLGLDQPGDRRARERQDDPGAAVRVHERHRRAARAVHLDGVRAAGQDRPIRPDAVVLRRPRRRQARPLRGYRRRPRPRRPARRHRTDPDAAA